MNAGNTSGRVPIEAIPATPGAHPVLIVDDDPNFRRIVHFSLELFGYAVLAAGSAEEAVRIAGQTKHIRLLITDIAMPVMNGSELAQKIREIHPDIEVLYVSGFPLNAMAGRGLDIDSLHFLQKPFQTAVLEERIKALLGSAKGTGV